MSIKNLFNKRQASIENSTSGSAKIESQDFLLESIRKKDTFIPNVDFTTASNFAKFGSAYEYYTTSIQRIYNEYPYDGSKKEKIQFELSSSYLDKWIFDNQYPKTTGYVNFSHNAHLSIATPDAQGYGTPLVSEREQIFIRGGLHTASSGMIGKPLSKTFSKSIIYDASKNRTTTFVLNPNTGFTVEFWLKKDAFNTTRTEKEVIFDCWNSETGTDNGRFRILLDGATSADTFKFVYRIGDNSTGIGLYETTVSDSTITNTFIADWHHYALSVISESSGVITRFYVDGDLNQKTTHNAGGTMTTIDGLINGALGSLVGNTSHLSPSNRFGGKLSASLDEFRFWKTRRTSEQIYNNFYTHVGGGTNTDDANTTLGLYYKFNEGIVNDASFDSVVLDYSGRIANGIWTGYATGARNTGSAFVSSSLFSSEPHDPIIRSTHPEVVTLLSNLQTSGSEWDNQNTSLLYNRVPTWIREEDEDDNNNVKYLFQIIANYFDNLHAQITELPKLKEKKYYEDKYKPLPFADRLLIEKGIVTPQILNNKSIFEEYNSRDSNKLTYEKSLSDVKNLIYTNIYNNLDFILKSKGTEKSIRNMLRCFGIDDEIIKLNVYTDHGTHYFKDNYKQTTINKKYIDFNNSDRFDATIFQTSSISNTNTFVTGSKSTLNEIYSAFTTETNVIIPHKIQQHETGYFETNFLSASIFGMHEAGDVDDYTWETSEIANFQVYIVRESIESPNAKFVLTNRDSTINLETDVIREIYDNQTWNLAVRIKPKKFPFLGNVITSSNPQYEINFYGVNHSYGVVNSEFELSKDLTYDSGSAFLTRPKRFYVGAHKTNFTGSTLQQTDIKLGTFALYFDYLSNNTIKQHNLDPSNFGVADVLEESTMFEKGSTSLINTNLESDVIIWNFETVETSDASGQFLVDDFSSGSHGISSNYPNYITNAYHKAKGFSFPVSTASFINSLPTYANKKELPEISYTSDNVKVESEQNKYLTHDDDVSDNFFALEKSMYQTVSEEMLKMFASVKEFNTLIGKAVDRYRLEYKGLNFARGIFFNKVQEDLDFDRFTEYFRWIDSSISHFVSQLFPASSRHSDSISDVVESHILERNKYQNKFPILTTHPSTEGQMKGSSEIRYNWKTGHAPISDNENVNCTWQKLRKERTDITERETIRRIIVTDTSASLTTLAKSDGTTYQGSAFVTQRLSRPYKISQDLKPSIHGGINYPPKKDRDAIYTLTQRHGTKGQFGQPLNVVAGGLGTGNGIVQQQKCDDLLNPNLKKRVFLDLFAGKFSDFSATPEPINDNNTYTYRLDELKIPITIISESVNSGYNATVVSRFDSGSIITNVHSDTTSLTNHIPMQGPFTETWVGGHQHRHVPVNRRDLSLRDDDTGTAPPNNLDNKYTRPEAWRIAMKDYTNNDGAIGILGPDYGGPYPDPARKMAVFYREERAKRPVNVKNIRYTTGSRNIGNYKENYEIISAGGKLQNNLYLRKNPEQSLYLPTPIGNILPETTHPMSLFGQAPFVSGNVFGIAENNRQPDGNAIVRSPVTGVPASGSFKLLGFQHAQSGHILQVTSSATDLRKFTIGNSSDTSSERFFTGSSDTEFFNNFTASFKGTATTDSSTFNSRYSISYTTSSAVYSMAMQSEKTHGAGKVLQSEDATTDVHPTFFTIYANVLVNSASVSGGHTIFMLTSSNSLSSNPPDATHHLEIRSNNDLVFDLKFTGSGGQAISRKFTHANFGSTYLNKWTNIIFTYNSGSDPINSLTLFINGVSSSITPSSTTIPTNAAYGIPSPEALFVFNRSPVTATDFRGAISELIFYKAPMTEAQADQLYNCGIAPTTINDSHLPFPGPVRLSHFYTFGDHAADDPTNGGKIIDLSANANHLDVIDTHGSGFFSFITSSVPLTASQAEFFITASQNGSAFNIDFNSSKCSFTIVNDVAGGVDDDPGDVRRALDVVNSVITSSVTNTVITSRFSAPGSIETSHPYLDVYSREFSVYNNLNYRNLSVRGSGSGEATTIRVNSQAGRREGLRALLSRHSGKFGIDSEHGTIRSEDYATEASFHKTHRNVGRRPTDTSTIPVPVFNEDHNNAHFSSLLPRSDFQYSWVTSSLAYNYGILSGSDPYTGKQRIYGYAPTDGILSSSVTIGGESGFVAAINFPTASEIFGV